mmetsp:Transcript_11399/g.22316  ORF Transcript_11399/g.22316 Transcript_11399/m.22316 type:complete len:227 (-) Transcript_11399:164-844(-)
MAHVHEHDVLCLVHRELVAGTLPDTVAKRCSGSVVDEAENVHIGNLGSVEEGSALAVLPVGRHGENDVSNVASLVSELCSSLERGDDHCAVVLRSQGNLLIVVGHGDTDGVVLELHKGFGVRAALDVKLHLGVTPVLANKALHVHHGVLVVAFGQACGSHTHEAFLTLETHEGGSLTLGGLIEHGLDASALGLADGAVKRAEVHAHDGHDALDYLMNLLTCLPATS